jgi:hypothetical protein
MLTGLTALACALALSGTAGGRLDFCGPEIAGIDRLVDAPIVILGEVHGMNGQPAFVADLACRLAAGDRRVVVALEIGKQEQARFDAFLDAPVDSGAALAELLRGPAWTSKLQCGIASEARVGMLESIRRARRHGLQVRVVAIDDERLQQGLDPHGAGTRDAAMARNILAARRPGETVLVLVGNLHARTVRGAPWGGAEKRMATFLKEKEPRLLTLDSRYVDGDAWNCQPDMGHCGVHPSRGEGVGDAWQVERFPHTSPDGYDGLFQIGKAIASPPAIGSRGVRNP